MMVECSPPPHRFRPLLALRYDVDMGVLINELCQLGLPKEHSESIGRCARRSLNAAAACASGMCFLCTGTSTSLRLPRPCKDNVGTACNVYAACSMQPSYAAYSLDTGLQPVHGQL